MCMRITLVRSRPHPDDTTDVDKHGVPRVRQVPTFLSVTTLLGQEILYRLLDTNLTCKSTCNRKLVTGSACTRL